jgi:hypothetical protein
MIRLVCSSELFLKAEMRSPSLEQVRIVLSHVKSLFVSIPWHHVVQLIPIPLLLHVDEAQVSVLDPDGEHLRLGSVNNLSALSDLIDVVKALWVLVYS